MSLKNKLFFLIIIAFISPIIFIASFSAFRVYVRNVRSQQKYLVDVLNDIKLEIEELKKKNFLFLKNLTQNTYLQNKIYVFQKYWDNIDTDTKDYELSVLKRELKRNYDINNFENVSIYRKQYNQHKLLLNIGQIGLTPDRIDETTIDLYYSNDFHIFIFNRDIYFNLIHETKFENEKTGLILFQSCINPYYLSKIKNKYKNNIEFILYMKNKLLYSSLPNIKIEDIRDYSQTGPNNLIPIKINENKMKFLPHQFNLGNNQFVYLLLSNAEDSFFKNNGLFNIQLLTITLMCIFLSVFICFLAGNYFIKEILKIVKATNIVASGQYDYQLTVKLKDEMGLLAENFNYMVSEIKKNKEKLEYKNNRLSLLNNYLEAVFQSLNVCTLILDRENNIILTNESAKNHFKIKPLHIGKPIYNLSTLQTDQLQTLLNKLSKTKKPITSYHLKDNNSIYSANIYPFFEKTDQIKNIVVVLVDISKQEMIEKAMIQNEKLATLGQFAASIAHEIRNPIGIILNHIQLIASGRLHKTEVSNFMNHIEIEIKRINNLVEQFLHFSKKENLQKQNVNIEQLIQEIINLFNLKLKRKNISIAYNKYNGFEYIVKGNKDSLKQVFFNLINNSVHAINHDRGEINITLAPSDNNYKMTINDNGKGIEKQNLEKIFDPFYTDKINHTGLGLAISYDIIQKHKGTIKVSSELNKGTSMNLFLPKGK